MSRTPVSVALLLVAILVSPVLARKWTSKDGKFSVEAEFVDADAGHIELKRSDNGKVIKVPWEQLSQTDVDFVRAEMKKAGTASDTDPFAPPESATESVPQRTANTAARKSQTTNRSGPKLAEDGTFEWQVEPDPNPKAVKLSSTATIEIPFPSEMSADDAVFGRSGSPFVAIGKNSGKNSIREVWDLRTQRRVGAIRATLPTIGRLAISPDGAWMAAYVHDHRGKIQLWSFKTGKMAREIDVGKESETLYGLDFADDHRLVALCSQQGGLITWDIEKGTQVGKLEMYYNDKYAISPGGNYVAVTKGTDRIEVFDLRNGIFAGDLSLLDGESTQTGSIQTVEFSADGSELAVLTHRSSLQRLVCWSMKDGSRIANHPLSDEVNAYIGPGSRNSRDEVIQWLPNEKGWLILGIAVVDRTTGGPVWIDKDKYNYVRPKVCRLLGENRRLMVTGEARTKLILKTSDLPWKTIEQSARVVSAGGSPDDLGLPPFAKADRSEMKSLSLSVAPLAYTISDASASATTSAVKELQVGKSPHNIRQLMTAAANPNLLLVNGSEDEVALQTLSPVSVVFDLASGKSVYRFEAPPRLQIIDFSPTGDLGLLIENENKARVDVFDLRANRHILGFRPYAAEESDIQRQVKWAAFVDDEHLLTLSNNGKLVLWEIEGCRAIYEIVNNGSHVFFDRSRKYLAIGIGLSVCLIEPLTGRNCGCLICPPGLELSFITTGAFRQDGRRLALLLMQENSTRVAVWDLEHGKLTCDLTMPFRSNELRWTDPDHVLLENLVPNNRTLRGFQQETLVDIATPRVAWNYRLNLQSSPSNGPDDRLWCFVRGEEVVFAVSLPDNDVKEQLKAIPLPQPIFGRDKAVSVAVQIGAMPDGLEDRREREDALKSDLEKHFTKVLQVRGMRVEPNADTILTVSIKNLTSDEVVSFRSRYSILAPILAPRIVLSTSTVCAKVGLDTKDGITLWSDEHFVGSEDVTVQNPLKDVSLTTSIRYAQWQNARQWCVEAVLPSVAYHPDARKGAGESTLDKSGIKFLQRYEAK